MKYLARPVLCCEGVRSSLVCRASCTCCTMCCPCAIGSFLSQQISVDLGSENRSTKCLNVMANVSTRDSADLIPGDIVLEKMEQNCLWRVGGTEQNIVKETNSEKREGRRSRNDADIATAKETSQQRSDTKDDPSGTRIAQIKPASAPPCT